MSTFTFRRPVRAALLCCLLTATACGDADAPDGTPLDLGPKRYSQPDEELVIRHFFRDRRDGVFLDVGAYHWKNASTTLYLEKHLGWSGIAIDALEEFEAGYLENRPRTRFFTRIVSDESGVMTTLYVHGGVTSVNKDHYKQFKKLKAAPVPIQVVSVTLNDLLAEAGVESIDFLSMDIEGAEPAALAGFDIERFRPELVCIEASASILDQLLSYFAEHGYERIDAYLEYDSVNWYFRPAAGPP